MGILQHDYFRTAATARRMMQKFGMWAVLRRSGIADRPALCVIQEYNPIERIGKMYDPTDRLALVAASEILRRTPPDRNLDALVTFAQPVTQWPPAEQDILRISTPIGILGPANIVVYWELNVRK
jgi:hypothetical protein